MPRRWARRWGTWKYDDGSLPPSPTRVRRKQAEAERERLIQQQKQVFEEMNRPKVEVSQVLFRLSRWENLEHAEEI